MRLPPFVSSRFASCLALLVVALSSACDSAGGAANGAIGLSGGACYPNATCNAGLECVAAVCVAADADELADTRDGPADTASGPVHVTISVCAMACASAADCCAPGQPGCPGAFPANWACEDGFCAFGGCDSDTQCTFGGALPDYECHKVGGIGTCFDPCSSDADCASIDGTCSGTADDGARVCQGRSRCESDADCGANGACDENGACVCDDASDCRAPAPAPGGWGCREIEAIVSPPTHTSDGPDTSITDANAPDTVDSYTPPDTTPDGATPSDSGPTDSGANDAAPNDGTSAESGLPTTIRAIQTSAASVECTDDSRAVIASNLAVTGIVATNRFPVSGNLDGFYLTDGTDAPFSGLLVVVWNGYPDEVGLGDSVRVTGSHVEFYCMSELSAVEIVRTGWGAPPLPVVLSKSASAAELEPYEGMLVEVHDIRANDSPNYDEMTTDGTMLIDYQVMGNAFEPPESAYYSKVRGLLHYAYSKYRIAPRSEGDLGGR